MRWIRLLIAFFRARFSPAIPVSGESALTFRVWITDIDVSIMNHAALLTVMEVGRIDFMQRTGFLKLARKNHWYFVSASLNVQYIRPLKAFQKAILKTRVVHISDPWIYVEQEIIRHGKEIAICIVKSKVKKGKESVSIQEIMNGLGTSALPVEPNELIRLYEEVNLQMKQKMMAATGAPVLR